MFPLMYVTMHYEQLLLPAFCEHHIFGSFLDSSAAQMIKLIEGKLYEYVKKNSHHQF